MSCQRYLIPIGRLFKGVLKMDSGRCKRKKAGRCGMRLDAQGKTLALKKGKLDAFSPFVESNREPVGFK
jgi:hypothetical protein